MSNIRIIGDVHQNFDDYLRIVDESDYSIQLGDMGFDYSGIEHLDALKHKFIPGNHDNYYNLPEHAFKGDWGEGHLGNMRFMYIRGAYSVDRKMRITGISWWPEEEINYKNANDLLNKVGEIKPDIILSHDCPTICHEYGVLTNSKKSKPSFTTRLLCELWKTWKPSLWVFGHHHNNWQKKINKTQFICLDELCFIDLDDTLLS